MEQNQHEPKPLRLTITITPITNQAATKVKAQATQNVPDHADEHATKRAPQCFGALSRLHPSINQSTAQPIRPPASESLGSESLYSTRDSTAALPLLEIAEWAAEPTAECAASLVSPAGLTLTPTAADGAPATDSARVGFEARPRLDKLLGTSHGASDGAEVDGHSADEV